MNTPGTSDPARALPLDLDHLPDDAPLLKRMLAEMLVQLRESRQHSEHLQARLDQLLRRLYGPRAERINPNQLLLFPEDALPTEEAPPPPLPESTPRVGKRTGHGRQPLPKHLPRQRRVYELTTAERACPCCGHERTVIGNETSEQLDYVPASLSVIEHVRLTYACTHCQAPRSPEPMALAEVTSPEVTSPETIGLEVGLPVPRPSSTFTTAAKPLAPGPRCLATAGLLAHVIVSKLGDHLPLYRLEHIFGRSGVSLVRSTLGDWLAGSALLLRPLYQVMVQEVLQSWLLQTDDTPVSVQDKSREHTRQGRVWVYRGDVFAPYVVYDYTPNREQVGPQRFLANFRGYLQGDAYPGYDGLFATEHVWEVACWAHARRKFYEAQTTDPERGLYVLGVIRQLYAIEKKIDEQILSQGLSREAGWWLRLQLRHEQSRPLLNTLGPWLEKQREQVLPKSPIGEAIGYALNQWPALLRYTTQGYLSIDNNAAERALRAVAVGRKNYLFFGSDGGGATAAVLYSFVQSCKQLGIEPWRYLRDVLEQLPSCAADRLPELLPDRWAQVQVAQARAAPAAE